MATKKKPVLIQADVEQLERLDRWASEWTQGNRSRAVHIAVETLLGNHAAYLASEQAAAQSPGGSWLPGPEQTADDTAASRPITADLKEL